MSKCREAFEEQFDMDKLGWPTWEIWQDAWNARGKVDAEICRTSMHVEEAQIAIEQEQVK